MKHRSQLKHRQHGESMAARSPATFIDEDSYFPAPDPSTRVAFGRVLSGSAERPRGGELIVAAGLGAILISVCSKFVRLFELPSLSEMSVAALGGALAVLGVFKRKLMSSPWTEPAEIAAPLPVEVDLPSLTGQLSALLAQLRQQHGVVYRTRTWIEVVLPAAGFHVNDPTLARDLLAAAALDAGGVRADVAKLAGSRPRDEIVAASSSLIEAVQKVLATCEQSTDQQAPRQSDPSCWPASAC